jgi:hypothetical protein
MQVSSLSKRAAAGRGAALALALLAAGCGPRYDIDRPGTWQPIGANDHNLRAMLADPRDLTSGASTATDRANGPSRAVTRLYTDHRRQLLDVSLSKIAPSQETPDAPVAGAGAGAGAGAASGGSQ